MPALTAPAIWTAGLLGAAVAAFTTWLAALAVKLLLVRNMGQFLSGLAAEIPALESLKPSAGLIYAMLHQAPIALSTGSDKQRVAAFFALQLPVLLGLIVVLLALRFGVQVAMKRLPEAPWLQRTAQLGIGLALPYALFSVIIGWFGRITFRVNDFGLAFTGTMRAETTPLFLSSLVVALIVVAVTSYRPQTGEGEPSPSKAEYWFPSVRQAIRGLAFGPISLTSR